MTMRPLFLLPLLLGALVVAGSPPPAAGAPDISDPAGLQRAVQEAASAVTPALVRIHVVDVHYMSGREIKSEYTGSGIILTKEGHVITNHHVAGRAKQIVCTLADKEDIDAELVGTDPLTDICVIKLLPEESRQFPVVKFGDSSQLKVGDRVLAMGSPLALSQSVTLGIVSNTQLVMPDLLWPFTLEVEGEDIGSIIRWIGHDAEINPGNSGGPLVNLRGEVVGINEMSFGLSGAIPANLAREVAERLIADGKVARAWMGLEVQPLLKSGHHESGILVSGTIPGSPAREAGFQPGDILISLGGEPVSVRLPEDLPIFNQLAAALPVGREVPAVVLRDGTPQELRVVPREREPQRPEDREFGKWGMTGRDLSFIEAKEMRRQTRDGVLITTIRPGGPCNAAKPKMVEYDVILAVGDTPIDRVDDLVAVTERVTAGASDPVPLLVSFDRRGERYLTVVKVGEERLPDPARETRKAWLGVTTQVLTRELAEALDFGDATGVRVTRILPDTPAEQAGLQVGDVILALDDQPIPSFRPEHFDVFPAMVRQYKIGSEAELTVAREGDTHKLVATLDRSPTAPREMHKYRDANFEFTVRDIALVDLVRQQWQEEEQGPLVEAVSEGSWAALGHLAVGDLLLAVDGRRTLDVAAAEEIMTHIAAEKPKAVVLRVRRGIHTVFVELKPKWPDTA